MLSLEELKEALPRTLKGIATQGLLDKVNQASADPEAAAAIQENFVTYTSVLTDGRFKVDDYLNAVSYVSFKIMGYTNQEAYARAFPTRHSALVVAGKSSKEISAYVANYNKNKLVNLVLEQSLIPSWILHQDAFSEAVKTQVDLMRTANSEKVRQEAANSILTHLKRPEAKKIEIDLGVSQDSALDALKDSMTQLAEQQIKLIESGMPTREVAHQKLVKAIDTEADDIVDAEWKEESGSG